MRSAARRGLSTACCAFLVTSGLTAVSALPAHAAATPSEVTVVPAYASTDYLTDLVTIAGATGFLHQYSTTSPWLWTRYADGATQAVPDLAGVSAGALIRAGEDRVRVTATIPGHTLEGTLNVLDLSTGAWLHPALPTGGTLLTYSVDTMLVRLGAAGTTDGPLELRKFAADGTYATIPITGAPDGTTGMGVATAIFDATAGLLSFRGETDGASWLQYGLLDYATGRIGLIPVFSGPQTQPPVLSSTHIGFRTNGNKVQLFARSAIMDGTAAVPTVISHPTSSTVWLVGGDLLLRGTATGRQPIRLLSADGTERQVLPQSQAGNYSVLPAPAGALVVGGSGPQDWAVQQITPGGVTPVLSEVRKAVNAGVTLSRGLLRHVRATVRPGEDTVYDFSNHELLPGVTGPSAYGGVLTGATPCATDIACVRTVDGSGNHTAWVNAGDTSTTVTIRNGSSGAANYTLPAGGGSVVDVSDTWIIVNTTAPAKQYLIPIGNSSGTTSRAVTGAAAWFDTLWTAGPGTIQSKSTATGSTSAAIAIDAPCTPSELQANAEQVLWSCGPDGPSGVYNLGLKTNQSLPAGRYLLGDGFAVRHDTESNNLLRYDLGLNPPTDPAVLGTLDHGTLPDDRNITWAVDRFSGNVAYVDANNAVHVVDPGITRTAPAVVRNSSERYGLRDTDYFNWYFNYTLNRPVTSWQATLTRGTSGATIATWSGTAAAERIGWSWDGYLANKRRAEDGLYGVVVTATVDGVTYPVVRSTTFVSFGTPTLHSYDMDGLPTLAGIQKDGSVDWWQAIRNRLALQKQPTYMYWRFGTKSSQISAVVVFGDINKDRHNDLLTRTGNGYLWAYRLGGGTPYQMPKAYRVGTGWNRFDVLLTSGDLTGDGIADLLARDKATGALYRYNGTGRSSFANGVKLSGSYKGFNRLIGPGDINGDGKADLLLTDAKGYLYTRLGTGKGTFVTGSRLGAGWNAYNAILGVGDLNEDGHNDLLVRDKVGKLYRLLGTGKGTFAARQQIGSGYQKYAYLF
ncbi:FG-GAP repeat domain-containing protein [Actinoplanes regularis]|uniref:FG-GAP repeat domain-containing protein n=1 Tax=Actinoplanes regularis TaxID=52697 RepID=UPI0024A459C1|nr:VCBS repeat-containing protein [Actinoplanes regularis]GLW32198.1 hypothetical protein Areg01_51370 [Actinoplanes regularis]